VLDLRADKLATIVDEREEGSVAVDLVNAILNESVEREIIAEDWIG
jgi:hypothetical protein